MTCCSFSFPFSIRRGCRSTLSWRHWDLCSAVCYFFSLQRRVVKHCFTSTRGTARMPFGTGLLITVFGECCLQLCCLRRLLSRFSLSLLESLKYAWQASPLPS